MSTATAVDISRRYAGRIDYQGDVDFFSFIGLQGVSYQIRVSLGGISKCVLGVYKPSGKMMGNSFGSCIVNTPSDENGKFFIELRNQSSGYAFGSGSIPVGQTYTLSITPN